MFGKLSYWVLTTVLTIKPLIFLKIARTSNEIQCSTYIPLPKFTEFKQFLEKSQKTRDNVVCVRA